MVNVWLFPPGDNPDGVALPHPEVTEGPVEELAEAAAKDADKREVKDEEALTTVEVLGRLETVEEKRVADVDEVELTPVDEKDIVVELKLELELELKLALELI